MGERLLTKEPTVTDENCGSGDMYVCAVEIEKILIANGAVGGKDYTILDLLKMGIEYNKCDILRTLTVDVSAINDKLAAIDDSLEELENINGILAEIDTSISRLEEPRKEINEVTTDSLDNWI